MSGPSAIDRRNFLLLNVSRDGSSIELSCEQLLMKYLDARLDGGIVDLFSRLDHELRGARELRLVDTAWLARDDLKQELQHVLDAYCARGGRLVFE